MLRSVSARICVTDTQRARAALPEQRLLNTCTVHFGYLQEIIKIFILDLIDIFLEKNVMDFLLETHAMRRNRSYVRVKKNAYKNPFFSTTDKSFLS